MRNSKKYVSKFLLDISKVKVKVEIVLSGWEADGGPGAAQGGVSQTEGAPGNVQGTEKTGQFDHYLIMPLSLNHA